METYKREFIEFMVRAGALTFGDFTTKSGRRTPFFINTGRYDTGEKIARLGHFYAEALVATAVGLFAAIPAVIAYNTFLHRIKDVITDMEDFSLELLSIAERLYGTP